MEKNNPRLIRKEQFDWMLNSQNPSDYFQPSTVDDRSSVQQPPFNNIMDSSSSSMRPLYGGGGDNYNSGFIFDTEKQQFSGMGINLNPVRSILDYSDNRYPDLSPYNSYSCNNCHQDPLYCVCCYHPGVNDFPGNPIDRSLEFDFNRVSLTSPRHVTLSHPGPTIRNNLCMDSYMNNIYSQGRVPAAAPVTINRNDGVRDMWTNSFDLNQRGFPNVFDQNPNRVVDRDTNRIRDMVDIERIRDRDRVREYNSNPISCPVSFSQLRQQQPKQNKFPPCLKDIKGLICDVAKDQEGCQFLQMKCEEGKAEDVEMIFNGIKDHIHEVMVDPSMNYLAQKLFRVCNEKQMTHIVVSVITDDGSLSSICLNSHGTRAMQKMIELLTTKNQQSLVVSALKRITVPLTKNMNGHHVIQHCLKSFQVDEVQPILNVVADNCLDIATDKSGCCVVQQCVLNANGVSRDRLMTEIITNALHLSTDNYGNYVVQHILGMQIPGVTGEIVKKLAGNFVQLAMNKFASNVVEKCLKDGPPDESLPIIHELLNSQSFLSLVQSPFGNYVAQSALQAAKGALKEAMINKILKNYPFLHSHPHGKRVLALARNSKPQGSPHA